MAFGIALAASRSGFVVLVVAITFFQYRLTLREERALKATQGESYRRYLAAVPRLLPSLRPRVAAGGDAAAVGTGDSRRTLHVGVCAGICAVRGDGEHASADVGLHCGDRAGAADAEIGCARGEEVK